MREGFNEGRGVEGATGVDRAESLILLPQLRKNAKRQELFTDITRKGSRNKCWTCVGHRMLWHASQQQRAVVSRTVTPITCRSAVLKGRLRYDARQKRHISGQLRTTST